MSQDALSLARHDRTSPQSGERIWVAVETCIGALSTTIPRLASGSVQGGDWDRDLIKMQDLRKHFPKIDACYLHWSDGLSWPDTGIYEVMLDIIATRGRTDGCRSLKDIQDRYKRLDKVFATVRRDKRLKVMSEVNPENFREEGGVYFHIGRDGNPIFGGGGHHRLAIALILGIERIPAQLGVIHPAALETLGAYRDQKSAD